MAGLLTKRWSQILIHIYTSHRSLLTLEFIMNAISKPDLILGTIEDIGAVNKPIPALSILTKTNRFYAWMDRWSQQSYDAWQKTGGSEVL